MKRLASLGLMLLTACAPQRPHPVFPPASPVAETATASTPTPSSSTPPATDVTFLPTDSPEIQQALERYQTTGHVLRFLEKGGSRRETLLG